MAERVALAPEALIELAGRVSTVSMNLEDTREDFNDDGSLCSRYIDDALGDFASAWRINRQQLVHQLNGARDALLEVVRALKEDDRNLAARLGAAGASAGTTAPRRGAGRGKPSARSRAVLAQPSPQVPEPGGYTFTQRGPYTTLGFVPNNCTDYTAWALTQMLTTSGAGWTFQNDMRRTADGRPAPEGKFGDAYQWRARAQALGYPVDGNPAPGAVAYWPENTLSRWGHVGVVREVQPDGSLVIDSYNGKNQRPMFGEVYRPGAANFPKEFLHIVPGT